MCLRRLGAGRRAVWSRRKSHSRGRWVVRCLLGVAAGFLLPLAVAAAPEAETTGEGTAGRRIMLVVDNSGSMRANDPGSLLKRGLAGLVSRLADSDEAGLIKFDSKANVVHPLRSVADQGVREQLLDSIRAIDYSGQRTNIPEAVERALYELKQTAPGGPDRVIVLVTDGIIDTGSRREDVARARWLREDLLPDCRESGLKIFGVAFSEEADYGLLQTMARETGGGYYRALTEEDVGRIFDELEAALAAEPAREPKPVPPVAQGPVITEIKEVPVPRYLLPVLGTAVGLGLLGVVIALVRRRGSESHALEAEPGSGAGGADEPLPAEATLHDLSTGNAVKLTKRVTTIGRLPENDISIDEKTVSGHHAKVEFRGGDFFLVDLRSTNGTYVNKRRIQGEAILRNGDLLRFDRYGFTFEGGLDAGATIVRAGSLDTVLRNDDEGDGPVESGSPLETILDEGSQPSAAPESICRRHSGVRATERCSKCADLWCTMCIRIVEGRVLCPECV